MFSYNNGPSVMREMTQCNVPDVAFSEKVPQMVGLQCTEKDICWNQNYEIHPC